MMLSMLMLTTTTKTLLFKPSRFSFGWDRERRNRGKGRKGKERGEKEELRHLDFTKQSITASIVGAAWQSKRWTMFFTLMPQRGGGGGGRRGGSSKQEEGEEEGNHITWSLIEVVEGDRVGWIKKEKAGGMGGVDKYCSWRRRCESKNYSNGNDAPSAVDTNRPVFGEEGKPHWR